MELRPARRRLEALIEIARQARARGDADEGLVELVSATTAVLHADRSTLYLVDAESGELRSRVVQGAPGMEISVKVGVGLAGWTAMTGIPLVINDVLTDDRFDGRWDQRSGYRTETVLAVPILGDEGAVIGVIQALNKPGGFTDDDRDLLEAIAAITGLAVERARGAR